MGNATVLLHRLRDGDGDAAGELFDVLYDELHAMAGRILSSEIMG